jgi:hypothetical protein
MLNCDVRAIGAWRLTARHRSMTRSRRIVENYLSILRTADGDVVEFRFNV